MNTLSGRVALVTGASSGIGAATAQLLGAHGTVTYRADLETTKGTGDGRVDSPATRSTEVRLDVREEADWERVVATIVEEHGHLDALVHAAGISAASPLIDTTLTEWRRVLIANVDASFLAIKHGVQAMGERGGAIVLLGSASGIRPSAGASAYSTSKAAVSMLARAAAKELRESGLPIRVNVVSPGGVRTPMWRTMPFFQDLMRKHGSEEKAFAALEAASGDRFAEPEEVAQSVLFLVSDASSHVTGVEFAVDGGYSL